MAHSEIAKHLQRTRFSVRNKAFSLGLRSDNEYMSVREVAEALGVHPNTITIRWMRNYGFPRKKSHYSYRIEYEDLMDWLRAHADLWSAKHLESYALGTEPNWLIEKRKHEQLPKGGSLWTEWEKEQAARMYRQGASNKEIGEAFGRTEEAARKLLYRIGTYGGKPCGKGGI